MTHTIANKADIMIETFFILKTSSLAAKDLIFRDIKIILSKRTKTFSHVLI
jgi:hypothetical protein